MTCVGARAPASLPLSGPPSGAAASVRPSAELAAAAAEFCLLPCTFTTWADAWECSLMQVRGSSWGCYYKATTGARHDRYTPNGCGPGQAAQPWPTTFPHVLGVSVRSVIQAVLCPTCIRIRPCILVTNRTPPYPDALFLPVQASRARLASITWPPLPRVARPTAVLRPGPRQARRRRCRTGGGGAAVGGRS